MTRLKREGWGRDRRCSNARPFLKGLQTGRAKALPEFFCLDFLSLASAVLPGEEGIQRGDLSVTESRQPIFNVPASVVVVLATLLAVHLVRLFLLAPRSELQFILLFAFIPARYDPSLLIGGAMPGGLAADIWTFVTYSLIHADFMHLGFNSIWLLAFGTPIARRFGTFRFFAFLAVTAVAGAAAHLLTHARELAPMVGASASVSGAMAASMRFAFQRGGPLWTRGEDPAVYRMPALPLIDALTDRRVLIFLIVWFGLNFLFGLGSLSITGDQQSIAWQAHVGGFLAGLLLFGLFDPVSQRPDDNPATSTEI
jgi:membrane associated rhomboid family serine protease